MTSASELSVTIKDEEKTLTEKFLLYESYQFTEEDPIIKDCIEKTLKNFGSEPESIRVRASLVVS